jgi:hypothetical protein
MIKIYLWFKEADIGYENKLLKIVGIDKTSKK